MFHALVGDGTFEAASRTTTLSYPYKQIATRFILKRRAAGIVRDIVITVVLPLTRMVIARSWL
jgi:hypothetical protein